MIQSSKPTTDKTLRKRKRNVIGKLPYVKVIFKDNKVVYENNRTVYEDSKDKR